MDMNTLLSPIKEEKPQGDFYDQKPPQVSKMTYCSNEKGSQLRRKKLTRKSTSTLLTDSLMQLNIVKDEDTGRLSLGKKSKTPKRRLILNAKKLD